MNENEKRVVYITTDFSLKGTPNGVVISTDTITPDCDAIKTAFRMRPDEIRIMLKNEEEEK